MVTRSRTKKQGNDVAMVTLQDAPSDSVPLQNGDIPDKRRLSVASEQESSAQNFMEMSVADKKSVLLLTFLYILQGIPLGLAGSVPYILTSRKVSYADQATFSFTFWPFSLKLLWAPLVDSFYSLRFGRRRSWLIPTQYCIGIFMIVLSQYSATLLGDFPVPSGPVSILPLTVGFFALCFLAATQDIAVDGWALTMLTRRNVGWASSCNSVGQTAGYFIAYVLFLALESPDFCNSWLRSSPEPLGLVTLGTFLTFWGVVYIISTTLVMIFKSEDNIIHEREPGMVDTYKILWRIIRLRPIIYFVMTLFLIKFSFGASDGLTGLKLIAAGVPKEKLAFVGVLVMPFQLVLPIIVSKHIGNTPLSLYIKASVPRLLLGLVFALIVYVTPYFKSENGAFPLSYFAIVITVYIIHQVFVYAMFVSIMAFHAKISDPSIGGSYMTLLNTISNLAGNWPTTFLLYIVDWLTFKECPGGPETCVTTVDGYYIESAVCFLIGILFICLRGHAFRQLQHLPLSHWTVS